MKRIHFIITILLFVVLCGCDVIDEGNRYKETPLQLSNRKVLLEDITGQICVNCPYAAAEALKLQNQYGADNVILVSVHAGKLSGPLLRTSAGVEYNKKFNPSGTYPYGVFDRSSFTNYYKMWGTNLRTRVQLESPLEIEIENSYNAKSRKVEIKSTVKNLSHSGEIKLQLWFVESKIIASQLMPDSSTNPNYEHNHVLRDAVNGIWGESVEVEAGKSGTFTNTYEINTKWKVENSEIVGFVYDSQTYEILQAVNMTIIN